MKPHASILLLVAMTGVARAEFRPQFHPTLEIDRTRGSIQIDGVLDDEGWRGAARAAGFAEVSPGDQIEPPVESEAWVTYDDENLYVALIARDDPSAVRVSMSDRDAIFSDDYFGIMIDTYGDESWGYELFVNPIGIQGDLRLVENGGEDGSFDIVWYSEGKITDEGYQVEIAVPFASLRFPDEAEQVWRVNFWRDHQRDLRRRYAWAATDRDNPCFICQWGTLSGIRGVAPGQNLDLIASAVASQAGARLDRFDPASNFENDAIDGSLALNVRYGLTTSSSAELALNPDFSQVESDAGQIDVNNPFALFFPERRPFFQEGSDLYNMWISAIYTRSVNNPDAAAKLAGQRGRTRFFYLLARDADSPIILPAEERSFFLGGAESISNIARVSQAVLGDSHVGFTVTDRRFETGSQSGTVFGADSRVRFTQNLQLEIQGMLSHTEEPNDTTATEGLNDRTFDDGEHTFGFDGESFWGNAVYASLERNGRTWNADFDYWAYSPTFRTDNGFTTRNDYRQVSFWTGMSFQPNGSFVVNWEPGIGIGRVWNTGGRFKDEWIEPRVFVELPGQVTVNASYLRSKERFAGQVIPGIRRVSLNVNAKPTELLSGGFSLRGGRLIFRSFAAPELGNELNAGVWLRIKPTQRLVIEPTYDFAQMRSRIDDSLIFHGFILRTRSTYQFTRELFARLVVQYNSFSDQLDFEPLVTYRVNPFTMFFLGSTGNFQFLDADADASDSIHDSQWKLADRQFFAKFQYLFRI